MQNFIRKWHCIVDDEEIIRDKLSSIIDWASLGYELAGIFEDGNEVISFLRNNDVDVILTDIKMIFCTGIDVARYVHENKNNAKIVLISGFQDFEFARQAMSYGVNHYIYSNHLEIDKYIAMFELIQYNR